MIDLLFHVKNSGCVCANDINSVIRLKESPWKRKSLEVQGKRQRGVCACVCVRPRACAHLHVGPGVELYVLSCHCAFSPRLVICSRVPCAKQLRRISRLFLGRPENKADLKPFLLLNNSLLFIFSPSLKFEQLYKK